MKKILNSILSMVCISSLFLSCETERDNPILASDVSKPVITSTIPTSLEITASNLDGVFTTVEFTPAVYSIDIPITNVIQMSLNNAFPADATVSVDAATSEKSIELKNKSLNAAIIELGAKALEPATAYLRVKTAVSATTGSPATELQVSYSDAVQVTITPYEPQPAWVYVPGQYQGWSPETAPALCSLTDNKIYVGYINFDAAGSGFKITMDRSWSNDYGLNSAKTNLEHPGNNIEAPGAGWYRLTVDMNSLTISMEQFGNLGVVGSINGWGPSDGGSGTPDIPMTYNDMQHRWEATITCSGDDEIKFRLNEAWTTNWGGKDGVAALGGDNIKIAEAGSYLVTLDLTDPNNLTYTVAKQ
ncbi:MAG: SusE domain-containing protein [Dysgonamonadaceae bacterium]|jgi:hypothetical protein|nr:SusE domain-containing protein [Dysgonamonadaceae bacterium]